MAYIIIFSLFCLVTEKSCSASDMFVTNNIYVTLKVVCENICINYFTVRDDSSNNILIAMHRDNILVVHTGRLRQKWLGTTCIGCI